MGRNGIESQGFATTSREMKRKDRELLTGCLIAEELAEEKDLTRDTGGKPEEWL